MKQVAVDDVELSRSFPQVFSHIGLIGAADAIEKAAQMLELVAERPRRKALGSVTADSLIPLRLRTGARCRLGSGDQPHQVDDSDQSRTRLGHEQRSDAFAYHQLARLVERGLRSAAHRLPPHQRSYGRTFRVKLAIYRPRGHIQRVEGADQEALVDDRQTTAAGLAKSASRRSQGTPRVDNGKISAHCVNQCH
jgi:hypothetical protein